MKIPEEAVCSVCKRIFCCGKCREKHEIKNHAIRLEKKYAEALAGKKQLADSIYVMCPICINRPFPMQEFIYAEMLDHIQRNHLPLHCQKCSKVYEKVNDLREFSKCVQLPLPREKEVTIPALWQSSCVLEMESKSVTTQKNTISTQTSPHLDSQFNGILSITPISIVNLQWKAKAKAAHHQDITDSVSSIKNLSLINNSTSLRRSIGSLAQVEVQGKLVRTTSTPVHTESESAKPKEQTFNASGGQVSSIYSSGCDTENQNSPVGANIGGGSTSTYHHQPEAVNLYRKFNGRTKIAAVTPLRQVMSKSIQKAFAEHGLPSFSEQKAIEPNEGATGISDAFSSSPLDLRLSPALRRSQSDSFYVTRIKFSENASREDKFQKLITTPKDKLAFHNRLIAGKQMKTESIMITRTQQLSCYQAALDDQLSTDVYNSASSISGISTNSIYKTCQSFEIITNTDLGEISVTEDGFSSNETNGELHPLKFKHPNGNHSSTGHNIVPITPITRLAGSSINKKAIQFDTPRVESRSKSKTPNGEKFFTPTSSPRSNEENLTGVQATSMSKMAVVRNLSARFSPSCRPSIRDCAQSTAYSHYEDDIEDASSNDDVFLEKTEFNLRSNETRQAGSDGFFKTIVNSVMRLPSLNERPNLITHRPGIHARNVSRTSIIKRCASIAGSLVRSTSLMDQKQLQTLKRKRTHTIDSEINSYIPTCRPRNVTTDVAATHSDLSSTKRFRIQGRKPIERMRKTDS